MDLVKHCKINFECGNIYLGERRRRYNGTGQHICWLLGVHTTQKQRRGIDGGVEGRYVEWHRFGSTLSVSVAVSISCMPAK